MADIVIFDVDGTLVDTNYQHAIAWNRALLQHDVVVPIWHIHRAIGMGGDKLVAHVAGDNVEDRYGDAVRTAWEAEFDRLIDEVRPFADARQVVEDLHARGFKVVLASSGKGKHVERFLDLVGVKETADAWTTSEDAEHSKPDPDLVGTAIDRVGGGSAVMIGDSTWDCRAARKLDVVPIAVQNGGFSREELLEAGASEVYESLAALHADLAEGPLAAPS